MNKKDEIFSQKASKKYQKDTLDMISEQFEDDLSDRRIQWGYGFTGLATASLAILLVWSQPTQYPALQRELHKFGMDVELFQDLDLISEMDILEDLDTLENWNEG